MRKRWRFLGFVILFVFVILLGSRVYQNVESWSYIDSVYFLVVTMTTIGYGDIVPRPEFRMVAAMQSIIGYICMGGVAATIYSLIQSKLQAIHKAKRLEADERNEKLGF